MEWKYPIRQFCGRSVRILIGPVAELEQSTNSFAIVTLAHLHAQEDHKHRAEDRYIWNSGEEIPDSRDTIPIFFNQKAGRKEPSWISKWLQYLKKYLNDT